MADTFTSLLEWRRNEAAGRALAKLPPEYYPTVSRYLAELKRAYEADLRENPSSRKGEISRQTYQRASQNARDVLEGRMQKVLSLAFQASIGGSREIANALPEERSMFDQLLTTFLTLRRTAAPYLEPGGAPPPAAGPAPPGPVAATRADPVPRPVASTPPAAGTPPIGGPSSYVRVVKDGRPIEVGRETVDLRKDDIVSLPPETAKILIDAKAAEPVTARPLARSA